MLGWILTEHRVEDTPARQGWFIGLGLKAGALASSLAHDSHHLVVAVVNEQSLLAVARRVAQMGGRHVRCLEPASAGRSGFALGRPDEPRAP